VQDKSAAAQAATRKGLMGDSDQLHQSVIAMQEASVAFTMMVEVRNKLVESYQELMRMQV
jgi:flagellar hook-basal body complex protein FliE